MNNVKCLCWNCGKEITRENDMVNINNEIWCKKCSSSTKYDGESSWELAQENEGVTT